MSWVLAGCSVVLGAAAGAVVPRPAYRLSVPWATPPRAGCVHCGGPFSPGRAGWVRVGRVCDCRTATGAAPWSTVAATGLTAGVLAAAYPVPAVAVPLALLGVLLAMIDLACLRLPDPLVMALAVVVIVPLCAVALAAGEPGRLGRAVLGAGLLGIAYLMMLILPGAPLGFGDVKLATVLGFALGFVGWPAVLIGAVAPHLLNGPVAVVLLLSRRAGRRTALPLGPALLVGALIAVALRAA
jgi:leader peptidase (prepilin peptidase)/N-methyltransferase